MYNTRQAEAMIDEEFLDIFLWCNHEVEGNLWRCNARVTIISLGVNGASDAIRKQFTTFHTSNRFMTSTILRNELSMGDILIRLELYDIFGYRNFVMFTIDFTKPSPLTDLNVGFQNSDVRVYVNTQYLSIHSAKFAHLFVRIKPGCAERLCPTTENKSEFGTCSDYDVLSMQSDEAEVKLYSGEEIFGARTHDVDNMCFLLPIWFQFLLHRQKTRGNESAVVVKGHICNLFKSVRAAKETIAPPFVEIKMKGRFDFINNTLVFLGTEEPPDEIKVATSPTLPVTLIFLGAVLCMILFFYLGRWWCSR
ncbi:hypothetical protein RB195_009745 [Necator americanus]|uniref:Uncharacterized protein n=2 Tax=Necator americanus TaxID=51031 RepID=A0ABR1CVI1_NECAM